VVIKTSSARLAFVYFRSHRSAACSGRCAKGPESRRTSDPRPGGWRRCRRTRPRRPVRRVGSPRRCWSRFEHWELGDDARQQLCDLWKSERPQHRGGHLNGAYADLRLRRRLLSHLAESVRRSPFRGRSERRWLLRSAPPPSACGDGAARRTAENSGRLQGGDFRSFLAFDLCVRRAHLFEFAPARAMSDHGLAPIKYRGRLGGEGLGGLAVLPVRDVPLLCGTDILRRDCRETGDAQIDWLRPALLRQVGGMPRAGSANRGLEWRPRTRGVCARAAAPRRRESQCPRGPRGRRRGSRSRTGSSSGPEPSPTRLWRASHDWPFQTFGCVDSDQRDRFLLGVGSAFDLANRLLPVCAHFGRRRP
jgi:hypothetical protein